MHSLKSQAVAITLSVLVLFPCISIAQARHTRRYHIGDNLCITSDSITLISQSPEESLAELAVDTIALYRNTVVAIADIKAIPSDTVDSVWVQVAATQDNFGWVREAQLTVSSAPDNPISITLHQLMRLKTSGWLFFAVAIGLLLHIYIVKISPDGFVKLGTSIRKKQENGNSAEIDPTHYTLHLRDIPSPYPLMLSLCTALFIAACTTIQAFMPHLSDSYYYHPSLNPFALPLPLSLSVTLFWACVVLSIATIDDVIKLLTPRQALVYLLTTAVIITVVCIILLYTVPVVAGYLLLLMYTLFAISRFQRSYHSQYVCGNCGKILPHKGECPHCNAVNE